MKSEIAIKANKQSVANAFHKKANKNDIEETSKIYNEKLNKLTDQFNEIK